MKRVTLLFSVLIVMGMFADTPVGKHRELILKPGTYTGSLIVADAQSTLNANDIKGVVQKLADSLDINVQYQKCSECDPRKLFQGKQDAMLILVVAESNGPKLLIAPNDRWAKVNTAQLTDDLSSKTAKDKYFAGRGRKLILRAFGYLCGGGPSQFSDNVMSVASIRELDYCKEEMPLDTIDKAIRNLKKFGITQREMIPYRRACKEGWAPAPTNQYQKAIWDKVHSEKERGPSNPIKILPPKGK